MPADPPVARDFIPAACAAGVAEAIPDARFVLLDDCGHFAYLERPEETRRAIDAFVQGATCPDTE